LIIWLIFFYFSKPNQVIFMVPARLFCYFRFSLCGVFLRLSMSYCWISKLLKVVSSLTHPSNVNSENNERGLQRVQQVYVCAVRKGKYIEKRNYAAMHLKM
jgi:hypothetical protein